VTSSSVASPSLRMSHSLRSLRSFVIFSLFVGCDYVNLHRSVSKVTAFAGQESRQLWRQHRRRTSGPIIGPNWASST